jgi:hypothetical protein
MKTSGDTLVWTCGFTITSGLCWGLLFPLAFAFGVCASLCFVTCMVAFFQGN